MNRVTDTCIPEMEAMRRIENVILREWMAADAKGERLFPTNFWRILDSEELKASFQIDPKNSWMIAAKEKNLPMFVPGWEDSTLGNMFTGHCIEGTIKNVHTVRTGIEYMMSLAEWYAPTSAKTPIGFSRSAAASRVIFRFVWFPCFTKIFAARMCHSGPTFAKSVTPRPVTEAILERFPTKNHLGKTRCRYSKICH